MIILAVSMSILTVPTYAVPDTVNFQGLKADCLILDLNIDSVDNNPWEHPVDLLVFMWLTRRSMDLNRVCGLIYYLE